MGQETVNIVKQHDRKWMIEHCPDLVSWTCCSGIASSNGCQKGLHISAPFVPNHSIRGESISESGPKPKPSQERPDSRNDIRGSNSPANPLLAARAAPGLSTQFNELQDGVCDDGVPEASPPVWGALPQKFPHSSPGKASRGRSNVQVIDTDYISLADFSPPLDTLKGDPATVFTIASPYANSLNLSNDPDQHLLHEAELLMASKLRMSCANYLCSKRRIFQGVVEKLSKGREYRKIHAQQACKIDARKARWLFAAFQQVGWFDSRHFKEHLPVTAGFAPKGPSDTDSLSFMGEEGQALSPPCEPSNPSVEGEYAPTLAPLVPTLTSVTTTDSVPMQPKRKLKALGRRRYAEGFAPTNDLTPDGQVVTREVLQWRKRSDGRKEMTPTCPYPSSWAEADSIDRTMVRMKRHEKRPWPEIYQWWCSQGRTSLKNASCLAVRYSIMKRKFEHIWKQEEVAQAEAHMVVDTGLSEELLNPSVTKGPSSLAEPESNAQDAFKDVLEATKELEQGVAGQP